MPDSIHTAVLSLGSNIDPKTHLKKALRLLQTAGQICEVSSVWETEAMGSNGPNFLNAVVVFQSPYSRFGLKDLVLHPIEDQLGRVRSTDKNAPRPIDLDIIVFDDEVVDKELWRRLYIARPLAELLPGLVNPRDGRTLLQIAEELHWRGCAILHPELNLLDG
jgi:2-amino-4-hydroxy-6-hydroxymethyldihydropteridine diphosphokinase